MYKKARNERLLLKELGNYLKNKRTRSGLSQSEVAKGLGYSSPQFISNFERGLCAPPLPALKKIMNYYKLPKNEIIGFLLRQQRQYLEAFLAEGAARQTLTSRREARKSR